MKKTSNLWRGLLAITLSLTLFLSVMTGVANSWRSAIDGIFGTASIKVEAGDKYVSVYKDTNELVAAHKELGERVSEEGSVLLKNENNALPLASGSLKVTLFGMGAVYPFMGGTMGSTISGATQRNLVAALQERGVTMYAASGTDDADVKAEAKILGLDGYFAEIAGAGQGTDACSKEAVLRRLVQPGRRLLVVGDGKVEIALGRETGALTLGIASMDMPGGTPAGMNRIKYERLQKAGAHAIAADFTETEALLQWM